MRRRGHDYSVMAELSACNAIYERLTTSLDYSTTGAGHKVTYSAGGKVCHSARIFLLYALWPDSVSFILGRLARAKHVEPPQASLNCLSLNGALVFSNTRALL